MSNLSDPQYEALARSMVALARLRGGPGRNDLCMHKALGPAVDREDTDQPAAGQDGVEQWLAEYVHRQSPRRILDLGCGFGTLAATLRRTRPCEVLGVNAASFPVSYGRRFWARNDPQSAPRLRRANFGEALEESPFDAIVALESLGYADDLAALFAWLSALSTPGATIWILDDWRAPGSATEDPDLLELCRRWHRPCFYSAEEVTARALSAGFEPILTRDLTSQVPAAGGAPSRTRGALLAAAASVFGPTALGEIASAFLGGVHLERLYARSLARYELLAFRRPIHAR